MNMYLKKCMQCEQQFCHKLCCMLCFQYIKSSLLNRNCAHLQKNVIFTQFVHFSQEKGLHNKCHFYSCFVFSGFDGNTTDIFKCNTELHFFFMHGSAVICLVPSNNCTEMGLWVTVAYILLDHYRWLWWYIFLFLAGCMWSTTKVFFFESIALYLHSPH